MELRPRSLFLVFTVLCCLSSFASKTDQIPARIGDWEGRPAWVSATEAIDSDGHLKAPLFARHDLELLTRRAQKSSRMAEEKRRLAAAARSGEVVDDCQVFSGFTPERFEPNSSIADLASNSKTVVVGTVSAVAQGFHYGHPGSLVRLSGVSYVKGQPVRETFFFYPYARMATRDGFVCSRPLGDYAVPQLGDRLLVFAYADTPVFDDTTILFADVRRELIHESRVGMKMPEALRSLPEASHGFDRVQAAVADAVRKDAAR